MLSKAIFSKVMWVGRATVFTVGLAVVLALMLSVATTALAAVPGDPFKLGNTNTIDKLSSLVGSAAGPLLRVDNNGGGPALDLQVEPGKSPMKVNSEQKVAKLNADKLDDKSSENFLPSDGKATDSDKLDGLNSTVFGQPFAFGTASTSSVSTGSGFDTYIMFGDPFTPSVSGKCLVTASTQIASSNSNTTLGPYYRIAIKRGTSAPSNDSTYGHYFQPFSTNSYSSDMTRSIVFDVNSGEPVQFGIYLGGLDSTWQGDSAIPHLTYTCITPSSTGDA